MRYDVFLSFRGEDTRYSITDHLYDRLLRAGLRTFRDNDAIDRGQELKPEIETAIIESRASVVVLSEKYAKSRWCLDELWLILEQRRKCNHFVLPVFYHVDPSDVRNQTRSFAIEGSKWILDDVRRWKAALTEVANLTGLVLSGSETEFIAKVVHTVSCKLDLKHLSTPAHLTGMETRAEVISSWLKDEQSNTNILAICGMGGSGKTTMAQYIYNSHKQNFESNSFLEEIGKYYKQPCGPIGLQKQLLRDVLGERKIMISVASEGTRKIENALQMKRALIVLDDIDDPDELNTLLGTNLFPTECKIIITTRLLDIQAWFRSISLRCWVHKLKLLNDLESLELLSWHAFGSKTPMEGFKELAMQLSKYCAGNPLALKVLGSSLYVSDEDPWRRNNMTEIWRSMTNALISLKGDLHSKIQGVLQKSFDSLPLASHKELFLHIACFFVGEDEEDVISILEDDLHAKSGIVTLINRCLLTVSPGGELMMHQLLQDMGKKIVCEESKDPVRRSRVWHDDESYRLLKKGDGSDTIEGLALDMRKVDQGMRSEVLPLKTSAFKNMDKLKLLRLKYVKLTGSYKNFPELRWLCWHGCNLKTIPSGLFMSSLVAIDMSYGHMEKFEAPMVLNSLKILNLKQCGKLVSICKLSLLPKLETLILQSCSSLTHVCKTIGDLESLVLLDLSGCTKPWKALPSKKYVNQHGGGIPEQPLLLFLPPSLKSLYLANCNLDNNNHDRVVFHAQSLFNLSLRGNLFEYMPNNIDLKMLRLLNLYSCPNLKSLLCLPSTLEELCIDWCTSLERITFQSGRFSLREFGYKGCFKLSEIQGLFKLVPVAKIDEADLGHMQWIKAYQDHKVDLVGDDITKGRDRRIQMLYEYGIMSTYLQGIKDQSMTTYEYTSSSASLSFRVPLHQKKDKIQGLSVSCLYRSSGYKDTDWWILLAKVSNTTKGLTWIYNPVVYCKPSVDEDVVWLSYWPIGNILDVGDEVTIDIFWEKGMMIVSGCGGSLVYTDDDDEIKEEENCENTTIKGKEVIGGDLSEFEVTTGGYYLCRRDFFYSDTSYRLKLLFGDNVHYTDSLGWRKTRESGLSWVLKSYIDAYPKEIVLGVDFNSESEINKIEKAVSSVEGVEYVSTRKEIKRLIVVGHADPIAVATCVREFENMVDILSVNYGHYSESRSRKRLHNG
ncbi:disease resistance protein RPV1 isoform X1 [Helianthus annuus]|uniref:Putative toll/interleukin-1 receptor (TIR) domain-containing protein n=1 Tax=Helianthus annuus TaxID=4232 RepID=A0A251TUL9_HELAN|nr:disease resistance protein RPV1 isoform X1 [Helianthus annuus]